MKILRALLVVAVCVAGLYGFLRFFVSQLSSERAEGGQLSGVVFGPPPGFDVVEEGDLERGDAANELVALLARPGDEPRFGIHFDAGGHELYWLVERRSPQDVTLTELAAARSGTRVETTWQGPEEEIDRRLSWAATHQGELDPPGLSPGEAKNLYH